MLSALTFFVWIKFLKRTDTIVLDTDWFYRRGGKGFLRLVDRPLNGANTTPGSNVDHSEERQTSEVN